MDVHVAGARPQDVPTAGRVLAAALRDDAVMRAMLPGDTDRPARLTRIYAAVARMTLASGGVVDLARDGTAGPVVGVAVWEPPDLALGRWAQLREVPTLVAAVGVRHLPAALRGLRAFAAQRPRYPHWFLAYVGAAPAARGQGVGSALLAHRLAVVDGTGMPVYLEATTDASRRLYERFGFRATGTIELGGATATTMVRAAG
ncbi:GNAT family N-acetyltransferase [Cellulomonas dongxiuzhuiae]|uniref:GNAT family N-acetyltransferase n=1 Tax=Cellulomonas dongxiuzhuiae TaxID=2819979 RepID=A0ABX8GK48_9CELL|nr:GNAT family N-acetyltransferase [Cellulomonas dongxiuzhuiae]MBO3095397.1 GNAT family N-acetyltransferase [Cellulomonas dongxiuzhuiae]QWC16380.1 GNAT family N-acetyltransferase [Cellulomonas dongxiuzhuiae]